MASRDPKYCRQRFKNGKDLAYVTLDGKKVYLGPYDSPASRQAYHEMLAERVANGDAAPAPVAEITVVEVIERFIKWAEGYFGVAAREVKSYQAALKPLNEYHSELKAAEFGPKRLKALQARLVATDASRYLVNKYTQRIKRVFRWAMSEELIPPSVYQALAGVDGLRRGHTKARETEPVKPVLRAHVDAVLTHVSRQVAAMIELQWLTGARSGEVVIMRPSDIDMSGEVWAYKPASHKTAHLGHERIIHLGAKAQAILKPFLDGRPPWMYLFSPKEAEEARYHTLHEQRKTPLSCGNKPGSNVVTERKRSPGAHYTVTSYRRAIIRGCELAKVPFWHPHQLRHAAATNFRKAYGLDAASVLLGHRSPNITTLYAEGDKEKAREIAKQIG